MALSAAGPAVTLEPVDAQDFDALAALRIDAMRESLEQLGRFDPVGAVQRLRDGFAPGHTRHIVADGLRVGFCALRPVAQQLELDHLYVGPSWQGRGVGSAVLERIARLADARGLATRVGALKGSRSNGFYLRHGFHAVGAGDWDTYYLRPPIGARRLALVRPGPEMADSYRTLVAEFEAAGETLIPFPLSFAHTDFPALLQQLADCERGIGISAHFIAHSSYWLVRANTELVAVSNLRHGLTPALRVEGGHIGYGVRPSARGAGAATEILRQTLQQAFTRGIGPALLTCARLNVASARTIVRNGGVLDSEEFVAQRGEVVQRYWVPTDAASGAQYLSW